MPRLYISRKKHVAVIIFIAVITLFTLFAIVTRPPESFPSSKGFIVDEGQNLRTISENLKTGDYIKSPVLFRVIVSFIGRDKQIQLGEYFFGKPISLIGLIHKMVYEKPDKPLVRITIPEGSTTYEIARIIQKKLPEFSIDIFGEYVTKNNADGKLFPSTYFFLPSTNEERVVILLSNTFEKKYQELFKDKSAPAPLIDRDDVIILASILEGEAQKKEDMQIIAGILLKRLKIGMALQVDVAKETYKRKGLPYEPINNPGVRALDAVFTNIPSPYLYYITGNDGKMYYAKTFEEHKRNIANYLK